MWQVPNIQMPPGERFAKVHFIDAVFERPVSQESGEFPQQTTIIYCEDTHTEQD